MSRVPTVGLIFALDVVAPLCSTGCTDTGLTPFVYKSHINAHQDLKLPLPIEVPSEGYVNVTLKNDPYAWFTVGELVLDPFIQGREIDDRIVSSFASAFRDNDRNGEPD